MSNDDDCDDEDVGYKKPPKKNQFQKGKSGNSKGRPKAPTSLKSVIKEQLKEKIAIHRSGKTQKVSILEAMGLKVIENGLKGDHRAMKLILDMMRQEDLEDEDAIPEPIVVTIVDGRLPERIAFEERMALEANKQSNDG